MALTKTAPTARALSGRSMWAVLFGLVIYHEVVCDEGQLLSEEVDRALERHPVLVYLFTTVTVAHLLNWLPINADPYHWVGIVFSRMKGTTK